MNKKRRFWYVEWLQEEKVCINGFGSYCGSWQLFENFLLNQ